MFKKGEHGLHGQHNTGEFREQGECLLGDYVSRVSKVEDDRDS